MPVGTTHLTPTRIGLYIIIGIIGIALGGNFVVESSKDIALSLGMSETLVGLTIVSIGTSLPELITSLTAAYNKKTDIAIGNAMGSNIFNILFILGLTDSISPIPTTGIMFTDTLIMLVIIIISYLLAYKHTDFDRKDGLLLIGLFIVYMIYIILRN
jgi:cation:H+ antiporter